MSYILNVLIGLMPFIVAFAFLVVLLKKRFDFSKIVLISVVLGIVVGSIMKFGFDALSFNPDLVKEIISWIKVIGYGYMKLLRLMVAPLILISIITALVNLKAGKDLSKMFRWIIFILVGTTLISALIGVLMVLVFNLDATSITFGAAENARVESLANYASEVNSSMADRLLEMIPNNFFADMANTNSSSTLGIVIFAVIVGLGLLQLKKSDEVKANKFIDGVNVLNALILKMVDIVLTITPFGVLALMATTIATTDYVAIQTLAVFVLASYVGLALIFVMHLILLFVFKINIKEYLSKAWPTLVFAFTSRSSAASIPLNEKSQVELGVDQGIASLSAGLGASIGQNGCAGLYPAMLAVMIAVATGINIDAGFIIQVAIVVALTSFGVAGVGGGATFAAIIVLSILGLDLRLAAVLISVEPLIDMGRTAINVSGSMIAGVITNKKINK